MAFVDCTACADRYRRHWIGVVCATLLSPFFWAWAVLTTLGRLFQPSPPATAVPADWQPLPGHLLVLIVQFQDGLAPACLRRDGHPPACPARRRCSRGRVGYRATIWRPDARACIPTMAPGSRAAAGGEWRAPGRPHARPRRDRRHSRRTAAAPEARLASRYWYWMRRPGRATPWAAWPPHRRHTKGRGRAPQAAPALCSLPQLPSLRCRRGFTSRRSPLPSSSSASARRHRA